MNFFIRFRPYPQLREEAQSVFEREYSANLGRLQERLGVKIITAQSDLAGREMFVFLADIEPDRLRSLLRAWDRLGDMEIVPTMELTMILADPEKRG